MVRESNSTGYPFPWRGFFVLIVLVFASSAGAFLAWDLVIAPRREMRRQLAERDARISELRQENVKLETFLRLLKHAERRARLEVLAQEADAAGRMIKSIRFTEISSDGSPLGVARDLQLAGKEIYLDTLVIQFEERFVEQGGPLKGKALLILRRLFSDSVPPDDGVRLDEEGVAPDVYAAREAPTAFERGLWQRFWEIANNEKLAQERGVKAIHGQAVYGRLEPGKVYELVMRSTGETILPPPTDLQP